ncbi:general APC amino acid permease [Scleroderma citrinum]
MMEDQSTTLSRDGSSKVQVEAFSIDDHEQAIPHRSPRLPPRRLKQRHVQMIAIAGTLGTGLFLGSGQALSGAGPLGALIAYSLVGTVAYSSKFIMFPGRNDIPRTRPWLISILWLSAARWVDPALGFAVGWNYFYTNAVTVPVELSGVQLLTQFYYNDGGDTMSCDTTNNTTVIQNPATTHPDISYPVTVATWVAACIINIFGARWFGEGRSPEFVFSIMKLTLIIGLIVTGLVIDLGGAPTKDRLGFRYWKNPGVFARAHLIQHNVDLDRFLGVVSVIVQAAFSFQGMEIAAIAASETESPRRNIAKAIRKSFFRILIFYILGIFVAGLIVPSNNLLLLQPFQSTTFASAAVSPYVIAMKCVSMRVLPQVVNAGFITSAFSAGNSFLFAASRILFGLALQKQAPSFFLKTKNGVPIVAVLFTASFGLLSLLGMSQQPQQVFQYGFQRKYVCGNRGTNENFLDEMALIPPDINIPIFIGLYLLWKLTKKTEIWTPEEMDFDTGIPTLEETELPYRKPHGFWGKFADAVF